MMGLQIVWASLSFGSYGLTTWINSLFEQVHLQNIYFNAVLFALSNLLGNLMTAWLLDSWGRQTMLTGSLLLASVALGVFGYAAAAMEPSVGSYRDTLIVTAACTFQAFTIAAWNTIDVVTAEVFPTTVRSTALGLCAATGRLAAMLAQIVNSALIAEPTRLLLTSSMSLAIGAIVPYCCIPDRTGQSVMDQVEDGSNRSSGSSSSSTDEGDHYCDTTTTTTMESHKLVSEPKGLEGIACTHNPPLLQQQQQQEEGGSSPATPHLRHVLPSVQGQYA
jgi:MFS family permease